MSRENIDDSTNRRKFLRNATLAVGTAAAIPGVAAAKDNGTIDTDFDPSSDREVRRFAEQFRDLPEAERQDVFQSLTKEQHQGLMRAFAPTQVETTVVNPRTEGSGQSSPITTQGRQSTREAKASAYSTLGFHLWDWFHRVSWEHNGSYVYDVQYNDYANVYDATWGYQGTKSKSLDIDRHNFEAYRQGRLTFLGGSYILKADPYARIKGYDNGYSRILSKGDGY